MRNPMIMITVKFRFVQVVFSRGPWNGFYALSACRVCVFAKSVHFVRHAITYIFWYCAEAHTPPPLCMFGFLCAFFQRVVLAEYTFTRWVEPWRKPHNCRLEYTNFLCHSTVFLPNELSVCQGKESETGHDCARLFCWILFIIYYLLKALNENANFPPIYFCFIIGRSNIDSIIVHKDVYGTRAYCSHTAPYKLDNIRGWMAETNKWSQVRNARKQR